MNIKILFLRLPFYIFLLSIFSLSAANLKAFPTAEGFAAKVTGGRGGKVYVVTNLNSKGKGSLQAALEQKGKRIIVFAVGGTIKGDIMIRNPNFSILGQTAPSPGITIQGTLMMPWRGQRAKILKMNGIIRFIRIRSPATRGKDRDCIQFPHVSHLMFDHVTTSGSNDESIDLFSGQNITFQWCTIESSDPKGNPKGNQHNYGMIIGFGARNITVHHNLFAHHEARAPLTDAVPMDYRNNVVYNMDAGIYYHEDVSQKSQWNLIGNSFINGPNTTPPRGRNIYSTNIGGDTNVTIYSKDNYISWTKSNDPWKAAKEAQGVMPRNPARKASRPFKAPKVETHSRKKGYDLVLKQAGCLPADKITQDIRKEVKSKKGRWGRRDNAHGLKKGKKVKDSDKDGMADAWEKAMGLSSRKKSDYSKKMPSGYSAIEEYANQCAAWLIKTDGKGKGPREGELYGKSPIKKEKKKTPSTDVEEITESE